MRIWSEVIGHLWAELGFWFFPRKWWKYILPRIFGQDPDILASLAGTTAGTIRERRRPYKLGGLDADFTWGLHGGETTSPERELFSQTWKKSEVGDSERYFLRFYIDATMPLAPLGNAQQYCSVFNFQLVFHGLFLQFPAHCLRTQNDLVRQ